MYQITLVCLKFVRKKHNEIKSKQKSTCALAGGWVYPRALLQSSAMVVRAARAPFRSKYDGCVPQT